MSYNADRTAREYVPKYDDEKDLGTSIYGCPFHDISYDVLTSEFSIMWKCGSTAFFKLKLYDSNTDPGKDFNLGLYLGRFESAGPRRCCYEGTDHYIGFYKYIGQLLIKEVLSNQKDLSGK
jgi:hypothetical protein